MLALRCSAWYLHLCDKWSDLSVWCFRVMDIRVNVHNIAGLTVPDGLWRNRCVREDTNSELCHVLSAYAGTVLVLYGNFPLCAVGSGFAPFAARVGQKLVSAVSLWRQCLFRVRLLSSVLCPIAGCSCSCRAAVPAALQCRNQPDRQPVLRAPSWLPIHSRLLEVCPSHTAPLWRYPLVQGTSVIWFVIPVVSL